MAYLHIFYLSSAIWCIKQFIFICELRWKFILWNPEQIHIPWGVRDLFNYLAIKHILFYFFLSSIILEIASSTDSEMLLWLSCAGVGGNCNKIKWTFSMVMSGNGDHVCGCSLRSSYDEELVLCETMGFLFCHRCAQNAVKIAGKCFCGQFFLLTHWLF